MAHTDFFYQKSITDKKNVYLCTRKALMAELVDALVSGTSGSNPVQVRVLFGALKKNLCNQSITKIFLFFYFFI